MISPTSSADADVTACSRTPPIPTCDASVRIVYGLEGSGRTRTAGDVIANLSSSKD